MLTGRPPRSAFQTRKPPRAGRPAWKRAEEFRRWLRKLPCACEGKNEYCEGPTQAAHVDIAGGKGVSTKVADSASLPLSMGCHRQQTDVIGWPAFEKTLPGADAVMLANIYWTEWPGRRQWDADLAAQAEVQPMRGAL